MSPDLKSKVTNLFIDTWSIHESATKAGCSVEQALDILESEDVQKQLSDRAERVEALYAKMPKAFYLEVVMAELARLRAQDAPPATALKAVLDCYLAWFREAPPPVNREFAERLFEALKESDDDES